MRTKEKNNQFYIKCSLNNLGNNSFVYNINAFWFIQNNKKNRNKE